METEDPRVAIHSEDVSVRAAAARDLARMGEPSDLPALLDYACTHKKTSVRLLTAGAAADILHRHRGLPGRPSLSATDREAVIQRISGVDPLQNPSLLMMWSALGDRRGVERLGRSLRDPRQPVRIGAMVALRRLALSAAGAPHADLAAQAAAWLRDRRLAVDTRADLARLAGEAGWVEAVDALGEVRGAGGPPGRAADEALRRLSACADVASWDGLWVGDGLDVFEAGRPDPVGPWVALVRGQAWNSQGAVEGVGPLGWRRVWATRPGMQGVQAAIQRFEGETLWAWRGEALAEALVAAPERWKQLPSAVLRAAAEWLDDPAGAAEPSAPDPDAESEPDELPEEPTRTRRADAGLLQLARASLLAWIGETDEARERARAALGLAKKSSPWRARAEALLASLG